MCTRTDSILGSHYANMCIRGLKCLHHHPYSMYRTDQYPGRKLTTLTEIIRVFPHPPPPANTGAVAQKKWPQLFHSVALYVRHSFYLSGRGCKWLWYHILNCCSSFTYHSCWWRCDLTQRWLLKTDVFSGTLHCIKQKLNWDLKFSWQGRLWTVSSEMWRRVVLLLLSPSSGWGWRQQHSTASQPRRHRTEKLNT